MNHLLRRAAMAAAFLLLGTLSAFAQQATITGVVTDSSGGVLPGVTITIVHDETGNTFEAVSDAQGQFRVPVRVGVHHLTAALSGFQTVTRTGLQLLLNQTLTVPIQLGPATLTETVTVTGEAPLVDTKESTVSANIDPRQVQDLPINFRNDTFNAKDFILNRVLPYSNQQFSMTVGGPILRDRLHYFAAYEFEHEPRTFNSNSAYAWLNREITYPKKQHTATQRVDWQLTPQTRIVGRATQFHTDYYN